MADLALLWHMHQPDYRHPVSGHFTRPWVLLHAIKDYADMASHLERHGGVRCTINFVPVLLDQIEDYCDQLESGQWRDPLLRSLALASPEQLTPSDRDALVQVAFHCHGPNMVQPHGPLRRLRDLLQLVQSHDGNDLDDLSGLCYADLATWCLLAWSGEAMRREGGVVAALMAKGSHFDLADRRALLSELARVMKNLVPRYRTLVERGQIEISCSPSHHPIARCPPRPSIPAGAPACRLNSRRHHAPRAAARRGRMTRTVALLFGLRGRWTVPRSETRRGRTHAGGRSETRRDGDG